MIVIMTIINNTYAKTMNASPSVYLFHFSYFTSHPYPYPYQTSHFPSSSPSPSCNDEMRDDEMKLGRNSLRLHSRRRSEENLDDRKIIA